MAAVDDSIPAIHSPPPTNAKRPKGILKNSFQRSPPASPATASASTAVSAALAASAAAAADEAASASAVLHSPSPDRLLTEKELTIENTKINAGHRRSSSAAGRPGLAGSRRQSSRTPSVADPSEAIDPRIKWDEANLYLAEQERTSTMKITEPKTPYAKHYDPSEDPSDDEDVNMTGAGDGKAHGHHRGHGEDDIPVMSLGEPEEAVPEVSADDITVDEVEMANKKRKHRGSGSRVHVEEEPGHGHDEEEHFGLSPEEREKHRRFEEMRKRHYEMRGVVGRLGHPENLDDLADEEDDDDEDEAGEGNGAVPPPMPPLPPQFRNGQST